MAKLGYTFYPKDWSSSDKVFELNLSERGFYRELIDLAMLNDNKTEIRLDIWARKFNVSISELQAILDKLLQIGIVEMRETIIFIPSCEPRLNLSRGGSLGGKNKPTPKPTHKPMVKPTPKQKKEKRKEIKVKEKENDDVESDVSTAHAPELIESFDRFNEWLKAEAPRVTQIKNQITIEQFQKLKTAFPDMKLPAKTLKAMHNYKPLTSKYVDTYLTLKKWMEKESTINQ
jgi:hypothetical protein